MKNFHLDIIIEDLFSPENKSQKTNIENLWGHLIVREFPNVINPHYLAQRLLICLMNKGDIHPKILTQQMNNILCEACSFVGEFENIHIIQKSIAQAFYVPLTPEDTLPENTLIIQNMNVYFSEKEINSLNNVKFHQLKETSPSNKFDNDLLLLSNEILQYSLWQFNEALVDFETHLIEKNPNRGSLQAFLVSLDHAVGNEISFIFRLKPALLEDKHHIGYFNNPFDVSNEDCEYFTNLFYYSVIGGIIIPTQITTNAIVEKIKEWFKDYESEFVYHTCVVIFSGNRTHYRVVLKRKYQNFVH